MVGKALWQNLKVLVDFDRQISNFDQEIDSDKKEIDDFKNQISKLEKAFEEKKASGIHLKKQIELLEFQVKGLDETENQKKLVLDNAKTQQECRSLEREIEFIVREKMKLENQITEQWYKLESLQDSINSDQSKVAEKSELLRRDIQIREASINDCLNKKDVLIEQRQSASVNIPVEWLAKYERMKYCVDDPIVRVVNDCCSSCFYAILRQDITRIKHAGILPCRNCYRFLYYDDAEQTDLQQAKF